MGKIRYQWLKPRRFSVALEIEAAAERVWEVFVDTQAWPRWGPSVRAVDFPDRIIRSGSAGRVKTALGFWVSFLVTKFEHGRYWNWKVGGVPATGHRVTPLGPHRCEADLRRVAGAAAD